MEENEMVEDSDSPYQGILDPNSKILEPVQRRIKEQLKVQVNELFLETKEMEESLKRMNEKREEIGVELYTRQQQLASLHENKEKLDENLNTIQKVREEIERKKEEFAKTYDVRINDLRKQQEIRNSFKKAQDKINVQVLQIEKRNTSLQKEIQVHRRKTYKAEEETEKLEKEKRNQDFLIDQLVADERQKEKEIQFVDQQIQQQKEQTEKAKEVLMETKNEMEELAFRKKTLFQVWKAAVIGMNKRDETVENLKKTIEQQEEKCKELENESEKNLDLIQQERDHHEELTSIQMRKENESEFILRQIESKETEKREHLEEYQNLKNILDGIDAKHQSYELKYRRLLSEIETTNKKTLKIANELRETEQKEIEILSDQTTFEKGTMATVSEIEKVKERIRDREIDLSKIENEISRVKIEILQTKNRNEKLHKELNGFLKELKERDEMIQKYQEEIKVKHDEIEKKQNHLDKLNRELERLKSNQQEENFGPLEATIHNLQKAILKKEKDNEDLNKKWIRKQNELVEFMNENEHLNDSIRELEAKRSVLYQKHLRLGQQSEKEKKETKSLEKRITKVHHQMVSFNQSISKTDHVQKDLASTNYDLENMIFAKIKEKQKEHNKIEEKIQNLMREKDESLSALLEIEKQIMYWEKKIEIQKEIQETLDPEVGQDEIRKMKKEIHVMEQKLIELKRESKKKVHLIERSVQKRETILLKGKAQAKRKVHTKASIKREIVALKNMLVRKKREKKRRIDEMKKLMREASQIGEENEQFDEEVKQKEREIEEIKDIIEELMVKRDISKFSLQREKRIIQDIQNNRINYQEGQEEKVKEKKRKIKKITREMKKQFPQYEAIFQMIEKNLPA